MSFKNVLLRNDACIPSGPQADVPEISLIASVIVASLIITVLSCVWEVFVLLTNAIGSITTLLAFGVENTLLNCLVKNLQIEICH